jgi:hypothetical protein
MRDTEVSVTGEEVPGWQQAHGSQPSHAPFPVGHLVVHMAGDEQPANYSELLRPRKRPRAWQVQT